MELAAAEAARGAVAHECSLLRSALLCLTDPARTVYGPGCLGGAWHEAGADPAAGLALFDALCTAVAAVASAVAEGAPFTWGDQSEEADGELTASMWSRTLRRQGGVKIGDKHVTAGVTLWAGMHPWDGAGFSVYARVERGDRSVLLDFSFGGGPGVVLVVRGRRPRGLLAAISKGLGEALPSA
jgi:hypothetical protein